MSKGGGAPSSANFAFLEQHDALLVSLGALAERYFSDDPTTALIKLRQFGEVLAQHTAANVGLARVLGEQQSELLHRLRTARALPQEVYELFSSVRRVGNDAVHKNVGTHRDALHALKLARELGVWFHRSFGGGQKFNPGPFLPPSDPATATKELQSELERLREHLEKVKLTAEAHKAIAAEEARARLDAEERAKKDADDRAVWEQLAVDAEKKLSAALTVATQKAEAQKPAQLQFLTEQMFQAGAAVDIDEADTRILIDEQLRDAGWEADSQSLRYESGTRPVKGRNMAIAEWPTKNGWRADYVLFVGLTVVGVVEAKRKLKDVSGSLQQAKRYSEAFYLQGDEQFVAGAPWGKYQVPFLYATNGRPWFKQLDTKSGIWFQDVRRNTNLARALMAWPTPEGLAAELKQDVEAATKKLKEEAPSDLPGLRPYQVNAIRAVEGALAKGKRRALVAMATGTGKTRTFIGLIYRLVKTGRFRRILFLVDRNALGDQASTAFKTEFVEGTQKFSDIFNIKDLADLKPDPETRLHFATVQAVSNRLFRGDDDAVPALHIDDYDCIVIDECHRGYTLDREMSDSELTFRDQEDYLSVYRRVIDYFDAVKIGLTATPALHTTEIFDRPVFEYSYREAVVEGFLVDHEPPTRIQTKLSKEGIRFAKGSKVAAWTPEGKPDFVTMPDELDFEVDSFNKQVVTENFNRVVCAELAKHIDPSLPGKTLIFCATDLHADIVVKLLSEAFTRAYGSVDADAVKKITGASDKPLDLIRRYRNEKLPSVAVTVDLLTTGIDVPPICNLVFLRRVRSRILYEQMLGRATRLWTEGDFTKEAFRIFDAVDLYAALKDATQMTPVSANPSFSFAQLVEELTKVKDEDVRLSLVEELLAKLQRKKRFFHKGKNSETFAAMAGAPIEEVLEELTQATPAGVVKWLKQHEGLVQLLDTATSGGMRLLISEHEDELVDVSQGFGAAGSKPEDYLTAFGKFLKENQNKVEALKLVTTRPRDMTRAQLKRLKLELDQAGYSEAMLRAAYKASTNADIAASIMGYIRQKALGDPLKPYASRVEDALQRVLMSRKWTQPQARWLRLIAKALVANEVVDAPLFDEGAFQSDGGFKRIDAVFDGKLAEVAAELQEQVWKTG